jgi:hypothetical protein
MAADIIVIVENENAGIRPPGAIKMPRREPADAAADYDQIIVFAGRGDRARMLPKIGIAQRVCGVETSRIAAAQPGQRWRIITRRILCRGFFRDRCGDKAGRKRAGRSAPNGDRNAVEKIAPRDPVGGGRKRDDRIVLLSDYRSLLRQPHSIDIRPRRNPSPAKTT